jgi:hypothetical protein
MPRQSRAMRDELPDLEVRYGIDSGTYALLLGGWFGAAAARPVPRPRPFPPEVDIPEDDDLYIELSTGCVTDDAVPGLRDDLTTLAAAMGVR